MIYLCFSIATAGEQASGLIAMAALASSAEDRTVDKKPAILSGAECGKESGQGI